MNGSQEPMHESRAVAYDTILEAWRRPTPCCSGDFNTYPRLVPRAGPS